MALLRLIALDAAELPVLSAHLQDAVVKTADLALDSRDKRFVLHANRFNWQAEVANPHVRERRRSALRIEGVKAVQVQGFDPKDRSVVLSILAVTFVPDPDASHAPAGVLTLVCAGQAALRFHVECVELVLEDLGPVWQASAIPVHPEP